MPAGRLPFTMPSNASHLPPISDYSMNAPPGRTYRYLDQSGTGFDFEGMLEDLAAVPDGSAVLLQHAALGAA